MVVRVYRLYKHRRLALVKRPLYIPISPLDDRITADRVVDIILDHFKLKPKWFWRWLVNNCKIYVADPWYHTVKPSDLDLIINACKKELAEFTYQHPVFDCDDFVRVAMGVVSKLRYETKKNYAFGYVWIYIPSLGAGHATCFFIDHNMQFRWFEPQICDLYDFDSYDPVPILIVI